MSTRPTTPRSCIGVVEWRRRRLIAAGFAADVASTLAQDAVIDLHAMLLLVDRGCPPGLAARICAPLEHETRCSR